IDEGVVRFPLALEHGETWTLEIGVQPLLNGDKPLAPEAMLTELGSERAYAEAQLAEWNREAPELRSSWGDLERTWRRSVADLGALRSRDLDHAHGLVPVAGTPWFMTLFGRDALITCLQTMPFGPELATSALRAFAELQATEDDPERDAELVAALEPAARRALEWIDGPGDRDGDGFVEYERRARRGIRNQSWKDSE